MGIKEFMKRLFAQEQLENDPFASPKANLKGQAREVAIVEEFKVQLRVFYGLFLKALKGNPTQFQTKHNFKEYLKEDLKHCDSFAQFLITHNQRAINITGNDRRNANSILRRFFTEAEVSTLQRGRSLFTQEIERLLVPQVRVLSHHHADRGWFIGKPGKKTREAYASLQAHAKGKLQETSKKVIEELLKAALEIK